MKRFKTTEERMDSEIEQVVELMRDEFPEAADYTMNEKGTFAIILNKDDKPIGMMSEDRLTYLWNSIEGATSDEDEKDQA